ncbi:MAG: VTT domain-containing protein, partial [Bacteroidota bacterium]
GRLLGLMLKQQLTAGNIFEIAPFFSWKKNAITSSLRLLIFARLSPALPFAMTNLLLGQLPLKWGTYLLGTMIGMLPRTALAWWLGKEASTIWEILQGNTQATAWTWTTLLLLALSTIGLWRIFSRNSQ